MLDRNFELKLFYVNIYFGWILQSDSDHIFITFFRIFLSELEFVPRSYPSRTFWLVVIEAARLKLLFMVLLSPVLVFHPYLVEYGVL